MKNWVKMCETSAVLLLASALSVSAAPPAPPAPPVLSGAPALASIPAPATAPSTSVAPPRPAAVPALPSLPPLPSSQNPVQLPTVTVTPAANAPSIPALPPATATPKAPLPSKDVLFDTLFDAPKPAVEVPPVMPEPAISPEAKTTVKKPARKKPVIADSFRPKERLSPKIYRPAYDRENQHLPAARYEAEYDALLFQAAGAGDILGMRALLDAGRAIEMQNADGETPLLYAVRLGSVEGARFLLARGANPNIFNRQGFTPLHFAAFLGRMDIATALLDKQANPNLMSAEGVAPLMLAGVSGRDASLIHLLADRGALLDARTRTGLTALHYAARAQNREAVNALVALGADVNAEDALGFTPRAYAVQ